MLLEKTGNLSRRVRNTSYPTPAAAGRVGEARMAGFCRRVGYSGNAPAPAPPADKRLTTGVCVVHLVRNSLRYASKKHRGPITKTMRDIYTSPTVEAAETRSEAFAGDWEDAYPAMIRSWRNA